MNTRRFQTIFLAATLLISLQTLAKTSSSSASENKRVDVSDDLDSLGGNDALMEKAKALDSENRVRIVQKRLVDRDFRLELGVHYGNMVSGDTYLKTQDLGANLDFHINPRWSLGFRYMNYGNQLTPEGQRVFDDARAAIQNGGTPYEIPDIDYPIQSMMGVIDWYPIYGKTSLLDMGIAQFDLYLLGGGGQIQLSSGWTNIVTAGTGVAIWLNKHMSARLELAWQNYHDEIYTGPRNINAIVGTAGIGFLL